MQYKFVTIVKKISLDIFRRIWKSIDVKKGGRWEVSRKLHNYFPKTVKSGFVRN